MENIGRFKIIQRLGSGGFGEVWLGHDDVIDRDVAIKVFNPKEENLQALATTGGEESLAMLRERFLNEARILSSLDANPYVISVLDFGELEDGNPYYVMPYLSHNLSSLIGKDVFDAAAVAELPEPDRPRNLPLDKCLTIIEQLISGLAAAHAKGLVHRDIKPANIMFTESGEMRLVDFGIAKMPDSQHSTVSQLGMGSQNYMAPEQRESAKHVDARADVFAVGALSYRIITGRLPRGLFAHPNVAVPELGDSLSQLIVECLSEDKDQRPNDAGVLAKRFADAKQQMGEVDTNATGTWVGGAGESTIRDELKPLRSQIETVLLAEGEMPEDERAALRTMAMIVDLDDEGLDDLIEVTTNELQAKLKPIQNLRKAIAAKVAENDVTERDEQIFLTMAAQVGWSEDKVRGLLQDGAKAESVEAQPAPESQPIEAFGSAPETKSNTTEPSQPTSEPIATETAKSSGSRWGVLVVLVLVIVGGGYGYTVYQDQQEQERIASEQAAMERSKARDLKRQDDAAWAEAESANTVAAYSAYTKQSFATTARKAEANQLIARLERAGEQERQRLAKLEADRKAKAESDRLAKLEAVGKQYPPGREFKDCSDCPEMVVIPTGTFRMGDLSGDGDAKEKPVHSVSVPSFAVGRYEVTMNQFRTFVNATSYKTDAEKEGSCYSLVKGRDPAWSDTSGMSWRNASVSGVGAKPFELKQKGDHPVTCISFNDAKAYIDWLEKKTGKAYRLPSESEWEYAARAGTTTKWWWGNSDALQCGAANGLDETKFPDGGGWSVNANCNDGYLFTSPIGSFKANAFGLYDTAGNVWEWTQDCWNESYAGAPSDGSAWTRGDCDRRVLRGGSWISAPGYLRSAIRDRGSASSRYSYFGFRVAQDL
jgi:formylglycine-generating enzyme required for sulfatase activity/serine/threonine protein kinase